MDPLGNNMTPLWGGIRFVSGCQGNLEVGDPLTAGTGAHHRERLHVQPTGTRVLQLVLQFPNHRLDGRGRQILLERQLQRAFEGLPAGRDVLNLDRVPSSQIGA